MHLELSSLSLSARRVFLLTLSSGVLISSSNTSPNLLSSEALENIVESSHHNRTRISLSLQQRDFSAESAGFDYATQKIKGVNVGGWLVRLFLLPYLFYLTAGVEC
jgi:hypothetical protein